MTAEISILIIDDSEDDRALYRRALTRGCGVAYDIVEAENGEHGLACMAENPPGCVLLDYSLPGRNGVEVLKRLRVKHPFVPVVMLTGHGNEAVAVIAMQEGAQNYISKATITPEALQRVIRVAIEHCAMEHRIHEQRGSLEIFTRALAHDLKEPVRTIKSFLSLLAGSEVFSEKGKGYFSFVQGATDRMEALIDAVYFYTRLDGSVQRISKEPCDADAVMEDAKSDISELIRERKALIASGPLPRVHANRRQLSQLLQNLLCNAIQHCEITPLIRIQAVEEAEHWSFCVADNGPGIDEFQRKRVFEPFKRLAHSRAKGLGLGLAICKRIVEAHGGKIWCEDGPEGGAAFHFTLPKAADMPAAQDGTAGILPPPEAELAGQPLAGILLVDDSEGDIELTRIMLLEKSKLRCNLLVARDAHIAIEMLREQGDDAPMVNFLLLDINMPGMDGFELLEYIRTNVALRDMPVVICSTSGYDKDMERAKSLGALGYVVKPAELGKLKPFLDQVSTLHLVREEPGYALRRAGGF